MRYIVPFNLDLYFVDFPVLISVILSHNTINRQNSIFQDWKDELLTWDKEDFDGVSSLKFANPESYVWMPDIGPRDM